MTHHTEEERKKNEARVDQAKVGNKVVDEPNDAETQVRGKQDFPNVQGEKDPSTTIHTNKPQQTYQSNTADPYARQKAADIDRNRHIPGYQTPDTYPQTDAEVFGEQQIDNTPTTGNAPNSSGGQTSPPAQDRNSNVNPNTDPYAEQRVRDVDRSQFIPNKQTPDTYAETDAELAQQPNRGEASTTESADAAAQQRDETGQGTGRLKITKEEKTSENQ